ncbi:MAG: erythromycin esterase family protein, partial [bacterium]
MKVKIIVRFLVSLFFIFMSCEKSKNITGTEDNSVINKDVFIQILDSLIYPLQSASPDYNDDDLAPLSYLGNSKIVGLGEATHGSREFFQLKHRIFKYLVVKHGFKIFGFECDMGESYYFDRYITEGKGNIDKLMRNKMHFWTWKTEEVKALLEWMKLYNEDKSQEEKIHYIGVDCQFFTFQPNLLLEYFTRVKPDFVEEITPTLNMIEKMGYTSSSVNAYYSNMEEEETFAISDSLDMILSQIEAIEDELITHSSDFEYQFMKQLVRNIQQVNDEKYMYYHESDYSIRDEYMAENVLWLSSLANENDGIAVWAHNGHIQNASILDGNVGYLKSLGYYIKSHIGAQYQIVGFSFCRGSFMAI